MAYFPIVGRLDCGSSSEEHQGFWEMYGYGIMAIYKSDWDRFGGEPTQNTLRTRGVAKGDPGVPVTPPL